LTGLVHKLGSAKIRLGKPGCLAQGETVNDPS
jgi:hypothetical protein